MGRELPLDDGGSPPIAVGQPSSADVGFAEGVGFTSS